MSTILLCFVIFKYVFFSFFIYQQIVVANNEFLFLFCNDVAINLHLIFVHK